MSSDGNKTWMERDLAHVWHPCTQMKDHETVPMIDGISSWWVNLFGHANPRINAALHAQLDKLEHAIFAGFTHEPAVTLAEELLRLAPAGLNRCFFADNGSAAIEVAVKMSFHYWRNCGQERKTRFITLANSYHGETLGALAVGNVDLYKSIYRPLLMDVITVPSPDAFAREPGVSEAEHARIMFAHMDAALSRHHEEVAAVIVEPLVQCAGGMRMYDPVYLKLLRSACDKYGVHLIADEIAVGFGRTGTMFACEQAGIRPDYLCLSKGLTGGYLPLSVVLTTDTVYDAFYDEYTKLNAFLHSHSYTGNPLACAAANATLAIFRDEPVIERNRATARAMRDSVAHLQGHPHVAEIRQRGMILAIELMKDPRTRTPYSWEERRGLRIYRHALSRGALIRPLGTTIYFMPPYVISTDEIATLAQIATEGVELACA
jgi:adenosylmethionine-8-amino-7-oxononanoate aminotransferase